MANYANLKSAIQQVVKTNGNNEITGALLQQSLLAMINSLGANYQFAGIATPSTVPGTPDQNVFYIAATAGTYTNFGGLVVDDGEIAILKYNGTWVKDSTGAASSEKLSQLSQEVNGGEERQAVTKRGTATDKRIPRGGGAWTTAEGYNIDSFDVDPGKSYHLLVPKMSSQYSAVYSFGISGQGQTSLPSPVVQGPVTNGEYEILIPEGISALYVCYEPASGSPTVTTSVRISGVVDHVGELSQEISELSAIVKAKQIETTLVQGYATAATSLNSIQLGTQSNRARTYIIQGNYTIKTNPGYVIRAVSVWRNGPTSGNPTSSFSVGSGNAANLVSGVALTEFTKNDDWPCSMITFCKTDSTANITPDEDIISELYEGTAGLVEKVEQLSKDSENIAISKAVFMGDSITHGVYSYWHNGGHLETDRYNGFDIVDMNSVEQATAYHGIPYYFGLLAKCPNPVINLGKRGSGYVADPRNLGNALAVATNYDFTDTDFVALCFGVNDYIQGQQVGDISTKATGTIIGNMCAVIEKILTDNPLCKVVVYSPYNTWGQVSYGGAYTSDVLYGSESTNYALGHSIDGHTLQDIIDAENTVCECYGIQHVPLSKSNVINRLTIKNILIDGLHPSKDSYIKLAAEIYGKGNFGN